MINFELGESDRRILDEIRQQALLTRRHARHYDENEEEFPPDRLEEAEHHPPLRKLLAERGPDGSAYEVLGMLALAGETWGDYSVRVRREEGGLGNSALRAAGTREQIERWQGLMLAMAITEPGCGSDPSRLRTSAVLDGDEWVLNGEKIFVTAGCRADGVVVWATIDRSAGRAGIKSFLVEKGAPGFRVVHKEKKLGIRADDTAALLFRDCRIPRDNLLGGDETIPTGSSGGFRRVLETFNMTRPATAALGLGIAEAALDFTRDALREAGVEIDYTEPAGTRPAAVDRFVGLEATFEAATLTVLRAAWLAAEKQPNNLEASVSKAKAGGAVREITQGCIEILGPMGLSREHLLEKWFRDARITDIYEGTGEIQRLIVARKLLGYGREELS